ncbi:MAG: MoxR family ATPase [Candidatus Thermoplasmatota archaeon]
MEDDFGLQIRNLHENVFVSDSVLSYIRDIIFETRNVEELVVGASPRAGEQLLYASKAFALINEKDYVIPDHVKEMARRVLPHRLIVSVEAELEDIDEHHILDDILGERVEAPKGNLSRN